MPTADSPLKERLARQFGAKDTRAWRLFLKRHPNLIASLAPRGEPSVSAGPAEATGSRIAEETPTQLERWLLVWQDRGRLVLARPMGLRSQILSSLTLSNLKTGSASDWGSLLRNHQLAVFGGSGVRRIRSLLADLELDQNPDRVLDLQSAAGGPDRRRRFARSPAALAERLGLSWLEVAGEEDLHAMAALLQHTLGKRSAGMELEASQDLPLARRRSSASSRADLEDLARRLPAAPGVYLMRDCAKRVYYVGSSHNLRRRVQSYLRRRRPDSARLDRLLTPLADLEVRPTGTELTALLEEDRWIRRLRPRGNKVRRVRARGRWGPDQVIVLPHASGGWELIALRMGTAPLRLELRRESDARAAARRLHIFFSRRHPAAPRGAGRREMEIVQSWLQRHLSRVARLPASSATTASAWQRLLLAYWRDPEARSRPILHRGGLL
jgi:hypothetical protein